jgi:hypothetical protein
MNQKKLKHVRERISRMGCARVIVADDGLTVCYADARSKYEVTPDVILVRSDGWSIGAPMHLSGLAYHREDLRPRRIRFLRRIIKPCYRWIGFLVNGNSWLYAMNLWPDRERLLDEAHGKLSINLSATNSASPVISGVLQKLQEFEVVSHRWTILQMKQAEDFPDMLSCKAIYLLTQLLCRADRVVPLPDDAVLEISMMLRKAEETV